MKLPTDNVKNPSLGQLNWLDLRDDAMAEKLDLSGLPELDDSERAAALSTWRGRMLNEHVSSRVFDALVAQAEAAGLTTDLVARLRTFAEDERRHGRMCGAVVHALGGQAVAPLRPLPAVAEHGDCEPLEALLRNVLSVSCLAETVAVALISAERTDDAPDPLHRVLTSILADEVRHARFGWTLLDAVAERLTPALRARLGVWLRLAFAHLERHELRFLPQGAAPSRTAERVGVCDGDQSRAPFYATVHDVIIPGLLQRGIPADDAWAARSFDLAA